MTLLDRMLERGFEMPIDPIIAARIDRHINRIKPDPLFQRRLRGQVVNRYVATREGMMAATRPAHLPRRSLSALGRAMLYASLVTAVSATAVGAAAQESLPGDVLYGVKIELESIRMELAPADLRDDLAAVALDERLEEVESLAAAGRWERVDAAVDVVVRAEAKLVALTPPAGDTADDAVAMPEHVDRLTELLAAAPDDGKRGLLRALAASGGSPADVHSNRDHQTQNRGQRKGQHAVPLAPTSSPAPTQQPAAVPTPSPSPSAAATPEPPPSAEERPGRGHHGGGGHSHGKPPKDQSKGHGPSK